MFRSYYGLSFNPFDKQNSKEKDRFLSKDISEMTSRLDYLKDLHGDIIGHLVDGDGGILVHFPGNTVQEALFQPFPGFRHADGGAGLLVPFHGRRAGAGMDGGIVGAHIVLEQPVKLCQRGDGIQIQGIEPCLLECSELAFDFCLGGLSMTTPASW